jgi:hypothetical protein
VDGIVRGSLVGDYVGHDATFKNLRQHLGRIADQANRHSSLRFDGLVQHRQSVVKVCGMPVEIAGPLAELDAARLAFDDEERRTGHGRRQGLRAAHAAEPAGEDGGPCNHGIASGSSFQALKK